MELRMDLAKLSEAEFLSATKNTEVSTFALGFDLAGQGLVLKMRFRSRLTLSLYIPAANAIQVFEGLHENAKRFGWDAVQPREELTLTDADWDAKRALKSAAIARINVFPDAVLMAATLGGDLYQAFRLRPGHALQIAEEILRARDEGALHDLRTQGPTTPTKQ
jgi:hypothetical protein